MAICSKCGKELADDAKFCASCGTPVGGAEKSAENVADKLKNAAKNFNAQETAKAAGEKAKAAGGKLKELIDKLPFNEMASKVPSLAKVAGFANYAACALGVLLLVVIVSAITPNKASAQDKASTEKAAAAAVAYKTEAEEVTAALASSADQVASSIANEVDKAASSIADQVGKAISGDNKKSDDKKSAAKKNREK